MEQELSGLFEGVLEAAGVPMQDIPGPLATVVPLRESQLGSVAPQLPGVVAAVACVLALALANLTLLFLMRVVSRRRETLVRGALGGGPTRALAPVLAEAVLVCAAAFLVAVAAAGAALPAIRAAAPAGVPRIDTVSFSWEVLVGGTLAALLALALVSGAAVAAARRHGLAAGLQWAAQQVGGDGLPRGVRRGLIAGQVALALVLMTGATLMARSLVRLEGVDVGFQAAGLLQGRLVLPTDAFWEPAGGQGQPGDFRVLRIRPALESFRAELTRRLAAHPAVRQVALAKHTPLSGRYGGFTPFVREGWEGRDPPEGQNWITANDVDPAFLPMLGVRLVAGRWLTPDDDAGAPPVALISDALARRFWPDGDAVGGRFRGGRLVAADDGYAFEDHWVEVVGVVRSLREWDYRVSDETVYVPLAQSYPTGTPVPASGRGPRLSVFLRHDGPPGPVADHVRAVAAELLPGVPVDDLRPMTALVDDWLREPRFYAALLAAFGALGLGVAAGGIAALIAFGVSRRTREIGIRVALGAAAAQVVRAITGDVLIAGLAGLALGVWAAALLGRALEALLFEVGSADPLAVAAAAALVAAAGALALAGAVRRALAVDPVEALRAE